MDSSWDKVMVPNSFYQIVKNNVLPHFETFRLGMSGNMRYQLKVILQNNMSAYFQSQISDCMNLDEWVEKRYEIKKKWVLQNQVL